MAIQITSRVPSAEIQRRAMEAARSELRRMPCFSRGTPTCPAATPVAESARGPGAFCSIEESVLAEGDNPRGLTACFGNYETCPTWRTQKAWEEAQRSRMAGAPKLARMSVARQDRPSLTPVDVPGEDNLFTPKRP